MDRWEGFVAVVLIPIGIIAAGLLGVLALIA